MTWRTNKLVLALRSVARSVGVTRILARLLGRKGYENSFDIAMISAVTAGSTVWDIGANIGHYTVKFAEAVGESGCVVAFEPSAVNRRELEEAVSNFSNVEVVAKAMGSQESQQFLMQGEDELGATSRVVLKKTADTEVIDVTTGDIFASGRSDGYPAFIKIDVEGFELDVLRGMQQVLRSKDLVTIGVEVHFSLLSQRGQSDAPAEIEQMLGDAGFDLQWTDASHILARRRQK